jgi:hypothetical protein
MTSEPYTTPDPAGPAGAESIEAPRPTIAPFVLVAGLSLAAAGAAFGTAFFLAAGAVIFLVGLVGWIVQLLPGRGHVHVEATEPLPRPVAAAPGTVEQLAPGRPGYRIQLPTRIHPISSGVWGGVVGGVLMVIPALAYGLLSAHHSVWYPVNLLAGMVLRVGDMNLDEFHASLLIAGIVIHVAMSLAIGLMLGVLLPTLPPVPRPLEWGGLLMPLLWSAVTFVLMGFVNPLLGRHVEWPWFIASQFVFGVGAAAVTARASKFGPVLSGILGGAAGGVLMAIPALLWSLCTGRGVWYPVNLLAGMVVPGMDAQPAGELLRFHAEWFFPALLIHAGLSAAFGLVYGLALPRLRPIPSPFVWGALLLPLLWTGASYGLMGVVNPTLQRGVEWPWFIVSQFVFGLAAAAVVVRSETIEIPPAGTGPDGTAGPAPGPAEVRS